MEEKFLKCNGIGENHCPLWSVIPFAEEYKNKLVSYSFGMILRESCWNENLLKDAGMYLTYEPNMHKSML